MIPEPNKYLSAIDNLEKKVKEISQKMKELDRKVSFDNHVLIVAKANGDRKEAMKIMAKLSEFNIWAKLWTPDDYFKNEAQLSNMQVIISVGGPFSNNLTGRLKDSTKPVKLDCGDEISVRESHNKALIWGINNSKDAVDCFIDQELHNFLKGVKIN